jgi:excinuclease ABC subunit A
MVASLLRYPEGTKIILLAPLVEGKKGTHADLLKKIRKQGFVRIRVNGETRSLDENIDLEKNKRHNIEAVIDRLVLKPSVERRLSDSVSTAVALSEGQLLAHFPTDGQEILMSEKAACLTCNISLPELTPQLFSFNSPKGACPECSGLGIKQFFDPDLVVPDHSKSLAGGAIAPWSSRSSSSYTSQLLGALAKQYNFTVSTPFGKLPQKVQELLLYGSGNQAISFRYQRHIPQGHSVQSPLEGDKFRTSSRAAQVSYNRLLDTMEPFEGVIPQLARRYKETSSAYIREDLDKYINVQPCPGCKGARLKPEALAVRFGPWNIDEFTRMSIDKIHDVLPEIELGPQELLIAAPILKEVKERLSFLKGVGLGYLSLSRNSGTLSGGESQRIRLASQIGSSLMGVLYILDEPSIGLHQRDNQRLIKTLTRLRDLGNTVLVVEHDADTIMAADHVLDMGPGAGVHGGEVVYNGPIAGLFTNERSLTGGYLSGRLSIPLPASRRKINKRKTITVHGAKANNLKDLTVNFPLGVMTCVTGVSGSGKSTLVIETLYKGAINHLLGSRAQAGRCDKITGLNNIDKIIDIDQSPIGRTPRSNPATYTGVLTHIRELFARLPESRARGYKPGRFSFNIKGGRCEACEGDGEIKIAMHFLPDVYITCETCRGKRYNWDTLEIQYKGKSIADILAMNVEEALDFFKNIPAIKNRLQTLYDVGLSYVSLGQSSVTLSGGEAQRIKLARELSKRSTGKTLYMLDEPTTGLHPADIQHLLHVLNRLVDSGNTAIIIEHNLDVIKTADHIIDLGPEGGDGGGEILAAGTPEEIVQRKISFTGKFLKQILTI